MCMCLVIVLYTHSTLFHERGNTMPPAFMKNCPIEMRGQFYFSLLAQYNLLSERIMDIPRKKQSFLCLTNAPFTKNTDISIFKGKLTSRYTLLAKLRLLNCSGFSYNEVRSHGSSVRYLCYCNHINGD